MSIKRKVAAALAAAALIGGTGVAGTLAAAPAKAATPSCVNIASPACVNLFSREFGDYGNPNYVADVFRGGLKTGQPVILFKASNADAAEDFTLSNQGYVSDFYAAGLVSSALELHYGGSKYLNITSNPTVGPDEQAFEIEYSPNGVLTGMCIGVPRTAFQGEKVSLQPCGVSARTVWIWDTFDQCAPWGTFLPAPPQGCVQSNGATFPAINGSDVNFSHPFVLTYPRNGEPWARPRPQLTVANLTGFSNGLGPVVGQVPDWQLWGGTFGPLK